MPRPIERPQTTRSSRIRVGATRVGVIGASGYTGAELMRLLSSHPRASLTVVTAERAAGQRIGELYPQLTALRQLKFSPLHVRRVAATCEVVFVALPPGKSVVVVNQLVRHGCRVIDVGADFRLHDARLYPRWYNWRHRYPRLLKQAVYGLPEFYREKIASARLVANPGCYPTAILLGLAPLLKLSVVQRNAPLVVDAKSGLSGAGRSSTMAFQLSEAQESLNAYQIGTHRHTPEIEQELAALCGHRQAITFAPHLVPMSRGLLATLYVPLRRPMPLAELQRIYRTAYAKAPFVVVRKTGAANPKHVRGTNFCEVSLASVSRTRHAVITSAIDNLGKGAAGQAVQNLNLMMGWPETIGLEAAGLIV